VLRVPRRLSLAPLCLAAHFGPYLGIDNSAECAPRRRPSSSSSRRKSVIAAKGRHDTYAICTYFAYSPLPPAYEFTQCEFRISARQFRSPCVCVWWIIIFGYTRIIVLDILRSPPRLTSQPHRRTTARDRDSGESAHLRSIVSYLFSFSLSAAGSMRDPETRDGTSRAVALIALDRLPSCYL